MQVPGYQRIESFGKGYRAAPVCCHSVADNQLVCTTVILINAKNPST
jgi:hypothetical protein